MLVVGLLPVVVALFQVRVEEANSFVNVGFGHEQRKRPPAALKRAAEHTLQFFVELVARRVLIANTLGPRNVALHTPRRPLADACHRLTVVQFVRQRDELRLATLASRLIQLCLFLLCTSHFFSN